MYDVIVIGGGINGCGIARDAAGRGLDVLLAEQDDLASATSSASTKLIHGGLRYLEQYDFRLVSESLNERERLLRSAPHIIWPLEFILPHERHVRPFWMIRLGLFLYDFLGHRELLPKSKGIGFKKHPAGAPLKDHYSRGFSYSDCWADDARLVVLNAMDAAQRGATILTRTKCTAIKAEKDFWKVTLENVTTGKTKEVTSLCVVNAAGPWVRTLLDENNLATKETYKTRYSKGSHIIVPRLYDGDHAYILQQPDKRIVFAISYEKSFTLIGTTDANYEGDPAQAEISENEKKYLCEAVNRSFRKQVTPDDIVWHYSGVRPLLDSGDEKLSTVTRDYKLDLERSFGPPLLNVFGGKLTTFRKLATHAMDKLAPFFPDASPAWTGRAVLPGGDISAADFELFYEELKTEYGWADEKMLHRYARAYGTYSFDILENARSAKDLGTHYGDQVYETEVRYLITQEWAETAEDILWRRSKLGLHISLKTKEALEKAIPKLVKETMNDKGTASSGA